ILVGEARDFRENVVLAKINGARFPREALVGEQLVYDVEILHLRPEGSAVQGRATVDGDLVAEAEIFFAHLDPARTKQAFGEQNFVFSGELKHLLGLAKLAAAKSTNAPDGQRGGDTE